MVGRTLRRLTQVALLVGAAAVALTTAQPVPPELSWDQMVDAVTVPDDPSQQAQYYTHGMLENNEYNVPEAPQGGDVDHKYNTIDTSNVNINTPAMLSDDYNDSSAQQQQLSMDENVGSGHTATLRVGAGIAGGAVDPGIVARGDIFTGFDVRAVPGGVVAGLQADSPWRDVSGAVDQSSGGSQPSLQAGFITSDTELTSALSIMASATGAFFGGSAKVSASFGYDSSRSTTTHQVSAYTYGAMEVPGTMLANLTALELTDDALNMLTTNLNDFLDNYGTHFVKSRVYGCEASATYTFECTTRNAKQDISAALQASYSGVIWKMDGKVSTTYGKYANSHVCQYTGRVSATGLDVQSPSAGQMMNSTIMDQYWNGFSSNCAAAAQTRGQLLYVELGNWLEVPAVRNALANNPTAKKMLDFYGQMTSQDLLAVALGDMYAAKARAANTAFLPEYATPFATTGFFDRVTGQTLAQQPTPAYWQTLPSMHAQVGQLVSQATLYTYLNDATVAAAIQAQPPVPLSQLVNQYFQAATAAYRAATTAYQYAFSGVDLVLISCDYGGPGGDHTPASRTMYVPANKDKAGPCKHGGPVGMGYCTQFEGGLYQIMGYGAAQLEVDMEHMGVMVDNDKFMATFTILGHNTKGAWYEKTFTTTVGQNPQAYQDMTDYVHGLTFTQCPVVSGELVVHYIMPDVGFSATPQTIMPAAYSTV